MRCDPLNRERNVSVSAEPKNITSAAKSRRPAARPRVPAVAPVQGALKSAPSPRKPSSKAKAAQGPRGEFVYLKLRSEIRDRELRPGDRLRELEVAARLGVSRTPVREALKRLETEGVIVFAQPRGLIVTELSHSQMMELYAMREVLEGAAARFAAKQASPLQIDSLKQLVAHQGNAKSATEAAEINRQLHDAISRAAHNDYLINAMNVLSDALALLGTTTYSIPGRIESGFLENAKIVECIARHDADAAEKAAREHIRAASALRLGLLFGRN